MSHGTIFHLYIMWRHKCAGGLEKKLYIRSGYQRHRRWGYGGHILGLNPRRPHGGKVLKKILWPLILNLPNVSFLFNPRKLVPTKIKPSTVYNCSAPDRVYKCSVPYWVQDKCSVPDRVHVYKYSVLIEYINVQSLIDYVNVQSLIEHINVQTLIEDRNVKSLIEYTNIQSLIQFINVQSLIEYKINVQSPIEYINIQSLIEYTNVQSLIENKINVQSPIEYVNIQYLV